MAGYVGASWALTSPGLGAWQVSLGGLDLLLGLDLDLATSTDGEAGLAPFADCFEFAEQDMALMVDGALEPAVLMVFYRSPLVR